MYIYIDFDNTITNFDVLDFLMKHFFGKDVLESYDKKLKLNKISHDVYIHEFLKLLTSKNINEEQIITLLNKYDVIDQYFFKTIQMLQNKGHKVTIISSGFKFIIENYVQNCCEIIANEVTCKQDIWTCKLLEHTKEYYILDKSSIFIGDGISDISVVNYVDTIYAKQNFYLEEYCILNNVPHKSYQTFNDIFTDLNKIL